MLILVCCLLGGVGTVDGKTDISGKCVKMPVPALEAVTPSDVCRLAGYGPCLEASGNFETCNTEVCTVCGATGPVNCNTIRIMAVANGSARVDTLVCDMKTWGMIPQPDNVPGDFEQSIKNATDWILGFVGMIAVLMLIWGGINYLTSAGDEDKARTGKKTISYAIIGLVIAGIAYALVNVIITVIL